MNDLFAHVRAKALIISKNWDVVSDLTEHLSEFGIPFIIAESFDTVPHNFLCDYQPSYIFVSVDDFGGPVCVYDQLIALRKNMTETAVILVSSEFATDEYGTYRLPVADVSLRYPFTKSSLLFALKQAPINLSVWSQRCVSMSASSSAVSANH